ncbi:hypothetical protein IHO40_03850 [Wolbachia endosymbiont of Mansonella ozzardi]|nr:hypothetical protein [Wolbachia endosymbiont of Mansonella ozzardi]
MINDIISGLRSGKIKSKTEYDFRKFDERYLKDLKGLLSQKVITTSLQEESLLKELSMRRKLLRLLTVQQKNYLILANWKSLIMKRLTMKRKKVVNISL